MVKIITIFAKIIAGIIIAISFSSCRTNIDWGSGTKGNGNITTENRNITEDFTGIDVSSSIEVILEQSENKSVVVEADSNLQELISTKVNNGVLVIKPNDSYNTNNSIIVRVKMPKIDALEASSSSKITSENTIKSEDISINTSSAGEINVKVESDNIICKSSSGSEILIEGKALNLKTKASSGSRIEAYKMLVNEVDADASSGSTIGVHPIVDLKAEASSGANISYDISPKTISKSTSSGGSIDTK